MAVTHPPAQHIAYLDGWRGLAIIAVFAGHFEASGTLEWMGPLGVQLFFVLSGLLMGELLFNKQVAFGDFFVRRVSRVLPTFLLYIGAMVLYARFWQPAVYVPGAGELVALVLFLRTYLPAGMNIWSEEWPIGHLWSLNVEEHSYLLLALVALVSRRLNRRTLAAGALAATALALLVTNLYYPRHFHGGAAPWYIRSECAAFGLVASALIGLVRQRTRALPLHALPAMLPVLWCVVAAVCFSTYTYKNVQYTVAPVCLALAVNYLDRVPALLRTALAWAPLRWCGRCSFSLYLWQQPFHLGCVHYGLPKSLGCVLGLAVGTLSFYAVEDPVRNRINQAWRRRGSAAAAASAPLA